MLTRSNLAGCGAKDLMCFHTLRDFVTNIFGAHACSATDRGDRRCVHSAVPCERRHPPDARRPRRPGCQSFFACTVVFSVCSPHCRFCALPSAACTRRPSIPLPSRSASADCAQRTQVSMQRLRITILLKVLCRCSSFIDLRCMFSNDLQLAGVAFSKRLLGAQHRWCQ